jgi:hypothetical protein
MQSSMQPCILACRQPCLAGNQAACLAGKKAGSVNCRQVGSKTMQVAAWQAGKQAVWIADKKSGRQPSDWHLGRQAFWLAVSLAGRHPGWQAGRQTCVSVRQAVASQMLTGCAPLSDNPLGDSLAPSGRNQDSNFLHRWTPHLRNLCIREAVILGT